MDRLLSERARPYFEKAQKLAPIIREYADRAEREAQMPREVADAFHDSGLFRILVPRNMDGGELTIPDSLRLCEEVSRIDAFDRMESRHLCGRSDVWIQPLACGFR